MLWDGIQFTLLKYPCFFQFLDTFEDGKRTELERCNELHKKIEELSSQMGQALDAVGTENLPSRSDFATMKEDLAFREGEVAKSKQTLEGLAAEQGQLKVKHEVFTTLRKMA